MTVVTHKGKSVTNSKDKHKKKVKLFNSPGVFFHIQLKILLTLKHMALEVNERIFLTSDDILEKCKKQRPKMTSEVSVSVLHISTSD